MDTLTAPTILRKAPTEAQIAAVSFDGRLRAGETISSISSIAGSPAGLTLGSGTIIGATTSIEGKDVLTGRGLTFTVTGGALATDYTITITVVTSAARTLVGYVVIQCRGS